MLMQMATIAQPQGEISCRRCGQHVGSWRIVGGKPEFHPSLGAVRRVAYGDGWLRLNCKRCDNRITLDHGGRAA